MDDSDRIRQAYDAVPYDSFPYAVTHPDRMGVIGAINSVPGAPATACRVLELGCAGAGNLIPMAEALPQSRFLGIDLSPRQIEQGNALVKTLGLGNIELRCQSIMDFPAQGGQGDKDGPFDYIICHGMYSWVPDDVREKLMEICARQLAPRGLCFISCKTYPGWHLNNVLRDLMLFHARNQSGLTERAAAARQVLEFVTGAFNSQAPQALLAKQMATNLLNVPEMYLSHDHLSPINHPVLFEQFARDAESHGLRYIGHADPSKDYFWQLPPATQQSIASWCTTPIEREQYVDFLCWRSIRGCILCRADASPGNAAHTDVLPTMHMAARLQETAAGDASDPNSAAKFSMGERLLTLTDPATIRAFRLLKESWPNTVPFSRLIDSIPAESHGDPTTLHQRLADQLFSAFRGGMVELWMRPVDFLSRTNPNPRVSALARWQSQRGSSITTRRHETFKASDIGRHLILLLDGTRDVPLLHRLTAPIAAAAEIDRLLQMFADESLLLA